MVFSMKFATEPRPRAPGERPISLANAAGSEPSALRLFVKRVDVEFGAALRPSGAKGDEGRTMV